MIKYLREIPEFFNGANRRKISANGLFCASTRRSSAERPEIFHEF